MKNPFFILKNLTKTKKSMSTLLLKLGRTKLVKTYRKDIIFELMEFLC